MTRGCRKCGATTIAPARVRNCDWICSRCANSHRGRDAARYLAGKLANTLRKHGGKAPYPGTRLVRAVLGRCHGRSVLSGEDTLERLCLVQVDATKPWTPDNMVVVTSGEAYALRRARNPTILLERVAIQR